MINTIKCRNFVFIILLCAGITACELGSSDGGGAPVKVSGMLGAGYSTKNAPGLYKYQAKAGAAYVDKVVAIPIETPFVASPEIMTKSITSDVNEDGSFSITLDKTRNWILLLIDSSLDRKNQIVSFAAMGDTTAGADTMILLPVSDAVSDIEMGTLEQSGDEGVQVNSMSENEENFSLNISDLRQIALSDNILKTVKNIYANYNPDTGAFYSPLMVFWWDVDAAGCMNSFCSPDDYTFIGYQPSFNSRNDTTFPYDGVKNKTFIVQVAPPENVTDSNGITYSEFSSNCELIEEDRGNGNFTLASNNPPFAFSISNVGWIQIGAGGCRFKNIVNGWWSLRKADVIEGVVQTGVEKAAFDLGVCSPISQVTGKPYVYLPSLKINVDAESNVTSFEIKWYVYKATEGKYVEVTDISGFKNIMEWVGLGYNDLESPGNNSGCDFSSVTDTVVYPTGSWKFTGTASGPYDIYALILGYRIYGVDFDLNIRVKK